METFVPTGSASTRLNDKLKNAFGIDLGATIKNVLEDKANLKLVPIAQSGKENYEQKRNDNLLKPYIWWIVAGVFVVFVLIVRR